MAAAGGAAVEHLHARRGRPGPRAARAARGWRAPSTPARASARRGAAPPVYSMVTGQGPPRRQASRICRQALPEGSRPARSLQRSTTRRASCSRTLSSSVTRRADRRQASLNSSKRSSPSISTSASLAIRSRYFWQISSNSVTSMRPVRSSRVRMTRGPRFFTSSIRPATVTGLPPPKRARLEAGDGPVARSGRAMRCETSRGRLGLEARRSGGRSGTARASRARRSAAPLRSTPAGCRRAAVRRRRAARRRRRPNMSFCPASCAWVFWSPSCMAAPSRVA